MTLMADRPVNGSAPTLEGAVRGFLTSPASPQAQRALSAAVDSAGDAAWETILREESRPPRYDGPRPGTRMLELVPPPRDTASPSVSPPADSLPPLRPSFLSRLRLPDGDKVITWAMAATVAVVAVDAAIVSYSHIYALATGQPGNGTETGVQPRLLPLSIDGVIAEASLVLLYAARHKLRAPKLAWFMLSLGITATVAANVAHGLPSAMLSPTMHVVISALLSAWPAGAFIGSVEMAMQLVRATRDLADRDSGQDNPADSGGQPQTVPDTPAPVLAVREHADSEAVLDSADTDAVPDIPASPPPVPAAPGRPPAVADNGGQRRTTAAASSRTRTAAPAPRTDKVTDTLRRHPDWDNERIAKACGVSAKTVQRRRGTMTKAENAGTSP